MSADIRVHKFQSCYRLKVGKKLVAEAISLDELETKVRNEHGSNDEYLVAIDIARSQERGC
ncbi:MAG: hypothetical protein QY322_04510 [bacterium]|nr:MAG: hypothetical protein QY322_04510 [bacterium]